MNKLGSKNRDKPGLHLMLGRGTDQDYTGLLIGLVIIGLGVTLLLDQEGVLRVWDVWRFWPLILVGVGLIRLLRAASISERMRGMVGILLGVVFQLGALGYKRFEFGRTWPLLVIGVACGFCTASSAKISPLRNRTWTLTGRTYSAAGKFA